MQQKENKNGVPANALWVSNAAIQVFLVITLFSSSSYLDLLYLATSMILMPYFFSTVYPREHRSRRCALPLNIRP